MKREPTGKGGKRNKMEKIKMSLRLVGLERLKEGKRRQKWLKTERHDRWHRSKDKRMTSSKPWMSQGNKCWTFMTILRWNLLPNNSNDKYRTSKDTAPIRQLKNKNHKRLDMFDKTMISRKPLRHKCTKIAE